MNISEYLANRLREILLSGKWVIGTNFKEQIEDLTWVEATKQVENFNSISDITFHINYYLSGVMDVFNGGDLTIRDKYSFDAPEIKSEKDWNLRKEKFVEDSESFIQLVENMEVERLMDVFVKEEYGSFYRSIDVIIEHTYYHLGQIILIKKKIREASEN
ncbi:DinB family protein [bacterium SCSIO 12643]|nr:DinB family protein [bacterium SCSIO 12643]